MKKILEFKGAKTENGKAKRTVKLGQLIGSRAVLMKLYRMDFRNGATAFRMRREISRLNDAVRVFSELRDEKLKALGVKRVAPGDPAYDEMNKWVETIFAQDIEAVQRPILSEADFEGQPFSASDIDVLVSIGFVEA